MRRFLWPFVSEGLGIFLILLHTDLHGRAVVVGRIGVAGLSVEEFTPFLNGAVSASKGAERPVLGEQLHIWLFH